MQVTQQVEFQKFVGLAETTVIAINPTNKELADLGYNVKEDAEEKEYITEKDLEIKDADGDVTETLSNVKQAQIDVYVRVTNKLGDKVGDGTIAKKTFFITNHPKKSKDQVKIQYISQSGDTSWAADESVLPDHFKYFRKKEKDNSFTIKGNKLIRPALMGESDLMELFIKNWLTSAANYFDPNTNILFDWKPIFKGNFKELKEMVGSPIVGNTVESFQIRTNANDDKQYQSLYKTSFPLKLLKMARTQDLAKEVEKWKTEAKDKNTNPNGRYLLNYEKALLDMLGEYGTKDFTKLTPLSVYDKEENLQASSEPMGNTDDVDYEL